jgi:hypothetical protein
MTCVAIDIADVELELVEELRDRLQGYTQSWTHVIEMISLLLNILSDLALHSGLIHLLD